MIVFTLTQIVSPCFIDRRPGGNQYSLSRQDSATSHPPYFIEAEKHVEIHCTIKDTETGGLDAPKVVVLLAIILCSIFIGFLKKRLLRSEPATCITSRGAHNPCSSSSITTQCFFFLQRSDKVSVQLL